MHDVLCEESAQGTVEYAIVTVALLSIVPSLILFFVNQKEFVEGVATTGLKG